MDLNLKGSQINLAARQKVKTKAKHTSLTHSFHTGKCNQSRPRSANIFEKRNYTILRSARPQSADPKFGRSFISDTSTQISNLPIFKLSKGNKKNQSVSSSNLLKLLLKEPIKRPWLCRDTYVSSDLDNPSDLSPHTVDSEGVYESVEFKNTSNKQTSENFSMIDDNYKQHSADLYTCQQNFESSNAIDLPGRVSFSQVQQEEDCGNTGSTSDLCTSKHGITVPGVVNSTTFTASESAQNNDLPALNFKKTVHFGAHKNSEEIIAETYEYPKCPSENCSCSTGSSSGSRQDCPSLKCICNLTSCKYVSKLNKQAPSNLSAATDKFDKIEVVQVIRDYKEIVGQKSKGSPTKNLWENKNPKAIDYKNLELPLYLSKYSNFNTTLESLQKPNNLTEISSLYKTHKGDLLKMDNNLAANRADDNAINNYLEVETAACSIIKKKENNRKFSGTTKEEADEVGVTSRGGDRSKDIKKIANSACRREDSKLQEFNIDKVHTWMSSYDPLAQNLSKSPSTLDESFQQLTKETLEAMKALDTDVEKGASTKEENDKHSLSSHDNSQDDSTYDEIVSVIKEIEDDKKKDNYTERSNSEMDLNLCLTEPHNADATCGGSKIPDKLQDILSYLDNVENSCEKTLLKTRLAMPDTNRSEIEFVTEPDIVEDVPKLADLLMLPNHQLARKVVALSLRANELANALLLSKEHVSKIRTEQQKSLRSEKANAAQLRREQKKHYEIIVRRHQGFIEQLLKDKGSLCEKVAALTRRLESQNQAWEHKLESEIVRVKENILASEKIRRERWVKENTKKIKELTVKGLEAEINKMSTSHLKELTELKSQHQQHLLDALEEARLKHEQIENSIRESCTQDRESVIAKERTVIRERFEKQIEEERGIFNKQKQKLIEDFNAEKEQLLNDLKTREEDLQNKKSQWQTEKELEFQRATKELQEKMLKQEEKYQNSLNTIEKQYETDFEVWKKEYENNCKMQQVEQENAIRQYYRTERDRQIDSIVQRMDTEALKNNEEFEIKTSRLKEKYEKDLQEAETVEKSIREKFTTTRNKLAESDAQVKNLQADIKQMQMELEHSKKMCKDFLNEREQLREHLKSELQNDMQGFKNERDQEIQQIHKRVQQAIEKKDATIDILQKENGTLRERCLKLEAIIRQQRKDYCSLGQADEVDIFTSGLELAR
uniref:Centrosomal protein of 131 kDa n=1 Tax=Glossina brevipalpis TaxID=37001 RepID=A0A1A9WWU9_9MUSC